jgi:NADH-quinone oxidoreductase subunit J
MTASAIIFYAISALILGSAILAVTTKKIFRAAIWLLGSLVGVAALYFWMQVEFIAAVQIIVYVGGIVVLIIFSIFLTHQSGKDLPAPTLTRKLFSALAALAGLAFCFNILNEYGFQSTTRAFTPTVGQIGEQMLSPTEHGYVLPFEVVSMLLLAAMVGCIVIAMRSKPKTENIKQPPVTEIPREETITIHEVMEEV